MCGVSITTENVKKASGSLTSQRELLLSHSQLVKTGGDHFSNVESIMKDFRKQEKLKKHDNQSSTIFLQ